MLGSIDPETVDAEGAEVVEIGRDGRLHIGAAGVEIGQADELAVLDVGPVAVVADVRAAGVEVLLLVVARVVVLAVDGAARAVPEPALMWLITASATTLTPAA